MTELTEQAKTRTELIEDALRFSLDSKWEEALVVNEEILGRYGDDEDTHNRIGKVLLELGKPEAALGHYEKALELDSMNQIAHKNMQKIELLLSQGIKTERRSHAVTVELFTEEPGKSALVVVVAAAGLQTSNLLPGDEVMLQADGKKLTVVSSDGAVLGEVDPRIGNRLAELIKTGNRYTAAVARVYSERLDVMIREVFQAPENALTPSFASSKSPRHDDFRPYGRDSLLLDRLRSARLGTEDSELEPDVDVEDIDDLETEQVDVATSIDAEFIEEPLVVAEVEEDDTDEDVRPEDEY